MKNTTDMTNEQAREWAQRYTQARELRDAVRDRLLGEDAPPVGDGRTDEYPEDVIIALLKPRRNDGSAQAIASGWEAALDEAKRALSDPLLEESERTLLLKAFRRTLRVAELTAHPLLHAGVRAVLARVLRQDARVEAREVQCAVAAAIEYPPDEADRCDWERALRTRPEVAALAFKSLLRLGSSPGQISRHLEQLIRKRFQDGWEIDVWFLADYVGGPETGSTPLIDALTRIAEEQPDLWQRVKRESREHPCWSSEIEQTVAQRIARNIAKHQHSAQTIGITEQAERIIVQHKHHHGRHPHASAYSGVCNLLQRGFRIGLRGPGAAGLSEVMPQDAQIAGARFLLFFQKDDSMLVEAVTSGMTDFLDRLEEQGEVRSGPVYAHSLAGYSTCLHRKR